MSFAETLDLNIFEGIFEFFFLGVLPDILVDFDFDLDSGIAKIFNGVFHVFSSLLKSNG